MYDDIHDTPASEAQGSGPNPWSGPWAGPCGHHDHHHDHHRGHPGGGRGRRGDGRGRFGYLPDSPGGATLAGPARRLLGAVRQASWGSSPEQVARVQALLDEAARNIYRILAEDPSPTSPPADPS